MTVRAILLLACSLSLLACGEEPAGSADEPINECQAKNPTLADWRALEYQAQIDAIPETYEAFYADAEMGETRERTTCSCSNIAGNNPSEADWYCHDPFTCLPCETPCDWEAALHVTMYIEGAYIEGIAEGVERGIYSCVAPRQVPVDLNGGGCERAFWGCGNIGIDAGLIPHPDACNWIDDPECTGYEGVRPPPIAFVDARVINPPR